MHVNLISSQVVKIESRVRAGHWLLIYLDLSWHFSNISFSHIPFKIRWLVPWPNNWFPNRESQDLAVFLWKTLPKSRMVMKSFLKISWSMAPALGMCPNPWWMACTCTRPWNAYCVDRKAARCVILQIAPPKAALQSQAMNFSTPWGANVKVWPWSKLQEKEIRHTKSPLMKIPFRSIQPRWEQAFQVWIEVFPRKALRNVQSICGWK